MAAGVNPTDTPSAVTMPGQWRDSSMVGISVMAGSLRPSAAAGASSASFSRRWAKPARAAESMPNVANIRRRASYGGFPSCSYWSRSGTISFSMNCRTAWRIITCSSDHSYMVGG
jgi:hypothetical protein